MKRVSFSEGSPTVLIIEETITDEDVANLYYSRDELANIISQCKSIILGNTKERCNRGLELVHTPEQRNRRKQILGEILLEQWRQRMTDSMSSETLAKVALDATAQSRKLANIRGKQDARAARDTVWERIKNGPRRNSLLKASDYQVEKVQRASRRGSDMERTI